MQTVKINFNGSLKSAFKKLSEAMTEADRQRFELLVKQCIDMHAVNSKNLKSKDLAIYQMTKLASNCGVKPIFSGG